MRDRSPRFGLAALGWTAVGIDFEAANDKRRSRKRAQSEGLTERTSFFEANIIEIEERFGNGSFDLVLCLGNTLPHLGALGSWLPSSLKPDRVLASGGDLVLQTLNFSLPGIRPRLMLSPRSRPVGATMRRSYQAPPMDHPESLRFVVELECEEKLRQFSETLLLPHGPRRMDSLLGDAGFRKPIRYSGWDGRPFDESRDLYCITVAAS